MHKRFVKLVRDRIPQFVGDSTLSYEPIGDNEQRVKALRAKLIEEAVEYLLNPSVGELADVQEVVEALCVHDLKVGWREIERAQSNKNDERGAFDEGLGMYCYTTAGAAHEGEHAHGRN